MVVTVPPKVVLVTLNNLTLAVRRQVELLTNTLLEMGSQVTMRHNKLKKK
jgi:hypothetical protein